MTAVRLDALTRDDIESSERDLHRVGSDLPHPSAVFDVLNGTSTCRSVTTAWKRQRE
jgi:hypothetical protein